MSGTDVYPGPLLVKTDCHVFYCSFSWIQPVLFSVSKAKALKKPQIKLVSNAE